MSFEIQHEDLKKLLYGDIFFLSKKKKNELEQVKIKWLRELLYIEVKLPPDAGEEFLFLRTLVRDDYKRLFHCIINECNSSKIVIEDCIQVGKNINIEASEYFKKNISIVNSMSFFDKEFVQALTIRFIYYCFIVENISSIKSKYLVCFSDMQPIEYLASIIYKSKGTKTITLQHGLYIEYENTDTVNIVNYVNQPSDIFLAWGDKTKALIGKYHPKTEVVICGKPDLADDLPDEKTDNSVLIIFDQEIFHLQNSQMFTYVTQVFERMNFDVFVKFHPHNNMEAYRKKLGEIKVSSDLLTHKYIIGHTSSLLHEAISIGCQVLQFTTQIETIPIESKYQFHDTSSLCRVLNETKMHGFLYTDKSIKFIGMSAREKYKEFFDGLIENKREQPFFSIIIPCFNSALNITKAVNSIMSQSFPNYEVLLMDGGSEDATLSLFTGYCSADVRFKMYSKPDKGTYDAMNSGVRVSNGKWIYFMGSDDELLDTDVLQNIHDEVVSFNSTNVGMVYGSVRVVGDVKWAKDGTIYDGKFDHNKIQTKNICHQSIFYKSEALKSGGQFNLAYKICADWDMNLRVWSKYNCIFIDRIIANFYAGGQSTSGSDPEFGKDFKRNINTYFNIDLKRSFHEK